jgi:hypothetical protein
MGKAPPKSGHSTNTQTLHPFRHGREKSKLNPHAHTCLNVRDVHASMKQPKLSLHESWRRLDDRTLVGGVKPLKYITWTNDYFLISTPYLCLYQFSKALCCNPIHVESLRPAQLLPHDQYKVPHQHRSHHQHHRNVAPSTVSSPISLFPCKIIRTGKVYSSLHRKSTDNGRSLGNLGIAGRNHRSARVANNITRRLWSLETL